MKKIIPAIALLLISAVVLSTASYAWFSMNTTVTAKNMQVTAKSDNTYLLIGDTYDTTGADDDAKLANTITAIQGAKDTEVDFAMTETKLYPAAPAISAAEVGYLSVATGHNKVGGGAITVPGATVTDETAGTVTNWYTANAITPDAEDIDTTTAKQLVNFNGFVVKKTVYLTIAAGANAANTLTVTPTFTQTGAGSDITAARILVVTSDGGFKVLDSTMNGTPQDIKGDDTDLTDATLLTVDMYIYYDGNDTAVFTENAAELTGASMQVTFDVTPVPAA